MPGIKVEIPEAISLENYSQERNAVNPFSKHWCRWKNKKRDNEGETFSRCLKGERETPGRVTGYREE